MRAPKNLLTVILLFCLLSCQREVTFAPPPAIVVPPVPTVKLLHLFSFSPDSAQVGDTVVLHGRNFDTTVSRNVVSINGTLATVLSLNDSTMRIRVNPPTTTGKITLISGAQTVTSTTDLKIFSVPIPTTAWIRKADFPVSGVHRFAMGFNSASAGYFFRDNRLWQYEPTSNVWTEKAPLPSTEMHNLGLCFTIGNNAYIGLGSWGIGPPPSGRPMTREIWQYDMVANRWTRKADFPGVGRAGCFSFAAGGLGYVGGGDTVNFGMHFTKEFFKYNPATDTWTKSTDYPGSKAVGSLGFALQDKGYVFEGGFGSLSAPLLNNPSIQFWNYDPQANAWQQKTSLNLTPGTRSSSATVFTIAGKGYAALGDANATTANGQIVKHDFWQYDPSSDTWLEKPQVGGPVRYFPCGFAVNGKGYVGMGTGTTIFELFSDFWQYNP